MRFSTLGLQADFDDKGILRVNAGSGNNYEMPMTGIEANELASDCYFYLLEGDVPEEWLSEHNIESRISDALQTENRDGLAKLEEEILGFFREPPSQRTDVLITTWG